MVFWSRVGEMTWVGTCKFSGKPRIGFKAEDGRRVFITADAVEVIIREGEIPLPTLRKESKLDRRKFILGLLASTVMPKTIDPGTTTRYSYEYRRRITRIAGLPLGHFDDYYFQKGEYSDPQSH
jgi:hypothetical protein